MSPETCKELEPSSLDGLTGSSSTNVRRRLTEAFECCAGLAGDPVRGACDSAVERRPQIGGGVAGRHGGMPAQRQPGPAQQQLRAAALQKSYRLQQRLQAAADPPKVGET